MFFKRIRSLIWKSKSETVDSWLRLGGNMTAADLLVKLTGQVEGRREIVRMLEEELKNMNQMFSDFVFLHKKISLLEMEEDGSDGQSRYL